jgi:hypothetical protein
MDNMTKKLVDSVETSLRRNSDKTTETSSQLSKFKKSVGEETEIDEKWSQKYKKSIDCSNPKGFSQKAHCAGKHKKNEIDEYSRTLKNARRQGSGLRFPKSAVKSNPMRFRPYNK